METTPSAVAPLRNAKEARSVLERLRSDASRFGGTLRALEAHAGYRWLRTRSNAGVTQRAWEHVRATTDELSIQLRAYRATLDRAGALLASRTRLSRDELAELTQILHGPVDLPAPSHGPAQPRSLADLMTEMVQAHADVLRTVTDVDEYSTTLQQRLNRLGEALRTLRTGAVSLTFRDDNAVSLVDGLTRELTEISPIVLADPLGCLGAAADGSDDSTLARLRRLSTAVADTQARLSAVRGHQAELQQSIGRLRERVAEVNMVEQECRRIENEVRARIAEPKLDDPEDAAPALRLRLDPLDRLRLEGQWPRLAELVRELEHSCTAAVQRAGTRQATAQALLSQRDELRGRLESYRAMLIRYGHAEDLDLADEYERAYQMLWTAPCDLNQAGDSVTRYQRAVIARTEASNSGGETGR